MISSGGGENRRHDKSYKPDTSDAQNTPKKHGITRFN